MPLERFSFKALAFSRPAGKKNIKFPESRCNIPE